jgi:hypothetical protein
MYVANNTEILQVKHSVTATLWGAADTHALQFV